MTVKKGATRTKKVREILTRLGELQAKTPSAESGAGTTFLQLQQAAAELGLNTELLKQAVSEVGNPINKPTENLMWGGPWRFDSDQIIPGRVTAENWPALVEDMRAKTGRIGTPKDSGMLFEWTSNQPDPLHVSVSPSGQNSRVRVTARYGAAPGVAYSLAWMTTCFVGMIALGVHGDLGLACFLWINLSLFAYFAIRLGLVPYSKKRNREMQEFVSLLEQGLPRTVGCRRQWGRFIWRSVWSSSRTDWVRPRPRGFP